MFQCHIRRSNALQPIHSIHNVFLKFEFFERRILISCQLGIRYKNSWFIAGYLSIYLYSVPTLQLFQIPLLWKNVTKKDFKVISICHALLNWKICIKYIILTTNWHVELKVLFVVGCIFSSQNVEIPNTLVLFQSIGAMNCTLVAINFEGYSIVVRAERKSYGHYYGYKPIAQKKWLQCSNSKTIYLR